MYTKFEAVNIYDSFGKLDEYIKIANDNRFDGITTRDDICKRILSTENANNDIYSEDEYQVECYKDSDRVHLFEPYRMDRVTKTLHVKYKGTTK